MHFERFKVQGQIERMVAMLIRDGHIELSKNAYVGLEKRLARIVSRYIDQYETIDEKTYKILAQHDVHPDEFYKRIFRKVAEDEKFPIESDALDTLNVEIEQALWDDDDIDEIFSDSLQLVAAITPYLKAMKRL